MRCTLSFDKKCFCCGAIFLNSVTGWNWTIFWSWTRVCFDASLFLPEISREPLHLGTRARCTSCPRGSDFRSKCIRRSQFFRWNCIPSLNLIEMHGSSGGSDLSALEHKMCTVHWPQCTGAQDAACSETHPMGSLQPEPALNFSNLREMFSCSHLHQFCTQDTFHPDQFLFPVSSWWWPVWGIF